MASLLLGSVLEALGEKSESDRAEHPTIRLAPPVEMPGSDAAQPTAAMAVRHWAYPICKAGLQ